MYNHKRRTGRVSGFTLVELSIVILIIGILVAGITGGAKLIEQAELRGVIADMKRYEVSLREFQLQYDALAGDFKNAAAFFTGCTTTNSHCGGNGDRVIEFNLGNVLLGVGTGDEAVRVFRHLYLAGIVADAGTLLPPANYSDFDSLTSEGYFPKSKISGSSYVITTSTPGVGNSAVNMSCYNGTVFTHPWTSTEKVTSIQIWGTNSGGIADNCKGGVEPAKAYQIDKKIDDASDSSGTITGATTGIVRTKDGATAGCVTGSAYNVSTTGPICVLAMKAL